MKKNTLTGAVLLSIMFTGGFNGRPTYVRAAENTLRIYNWGEYMYEQDEPGDPLGIVDQFKAWYLSQYGETINVEYSTFDVNETAYSQIKKLNQHYDLVAPSEYMIQKMASEDMLETFDKEEDGSYTHIPNYNDYASPFLRDMFDGIAVGSRPLSDYATGYMWGTVGLLYNPEIIASEDVASWRVLYDENYKKQATLKNSVREAYLIALIDVYHDEITQLNLLVEAHVITQQSYNNALTDILNRDDDETIALVEESLKKLKANSYGLEVDTGKNDIVNKNIGMQVTWSGDAVYSMNIVEESETKDLLYVVPEEAGNIWFDGWVMPKGANKLLAQRFINFISDPEIAILNMDYIGYTSFIAGNEVWDRVLEQENTEGNFDLDLSYFFEGTVTEAGPYVVKTDQYKQLHANYPDETIIRRSIVMRDFGDKTDTINQMWSRVKTQTLSPLAIGFIAGAVLLAAAGGAFFYFRKKNTKRGRRLKELKKK